MRMLRIIGIFTLLLFFAAYAPNLAGAITIPASVHYYIPITLTNSQTTNTPANFQQMLTFNALSICTASLCAPHLNNTEFFYSNGTIIPSWIESGAGLSNNYGANDIAGSSLVTAWVKLAPANFIPASGNAIIYMGFCANTTSFFSNTITGEAPRLSATYAQYDDGASVFNNYWNFAGTAVPTGMTESGTGITINNGISITAPASDTSYVETTSNFGLTSNILEWYGTYPAGTATNSGGVGYGNANYQGWYTNTWSGWCTTTDVIAIAAQRPVNCTTGIIATPITSLFGVYWSSNATSATLFYNNYIQIVAGTGAGLAMPIAVISVNTEAIGPIYYIRTRAYPPSGIMPSVSFGAVQLAVLLSISPNPSTYGQSITLTATCAITDTCAIDYPTLGTAIATGTGSATYTYNAFSLAAGTYSSFYANDITTGVNSAPVSITVDQNSTAPFGCKYNSGALTNNQHLTELLASAYLNCTITTHNGQVPATLTYNGTTITSTSTLASYFTKWDNYNNSYTWAAPTTPNYTAFSLTGTINYIPYTLTTNAFPATGYETSTQLPTYTFNITKAATNATFTLNVNGNNVSNSLQAIATGSQSFNPNYTIPLLNANNTLYIFNSILTISLSSTNKLIYNPANTLTQHEYYDYIPSLAVKSSPIITGDGQTWFMNISQPDALNLAIVNTTLNLGNQSLDYGTLLLYKYYVQLSSFVPSAYGLANPSSAAPTTISYNSPVKLTFDGASVWRNQSGSFPIYEPELVNCDATTPKAFEWTFYNGTSLVQYTGNVLLNGFFYVKNGLYSSTDNNGTGGGLTSTATNSIYYTCLSPSWAQFNSYGSFQYNASDFSRSQFLLVAQPTSNTLAQLKLYMQSITNPSVYDVVVENGTNNFITAYVQELLYNINLNRSVLVNEFQTPSGGGYVTNLQTGDYYQYEIFNSAGLLLNTTQLMQAACAAGSTCTFYIDIANSTVTTPSSYLNNIKYTCAVTNDTTTNTSTISCSVASLNGAAIATQLSIYQNAIFQNQLTCQKNMSAGSYSINCQATHTNINAYTWQLIYLTPTGQLILGNGNFGHASSMFGSIGIIIALLIVGMFSIVFVFVNPTVSIIAATIGMIMCGALNLIMLNVVSMGFLIVFAAIAVFAMTRRE